MLALLPLLASAQLPSSAQRVVFMVGVEPGQPGSHLMGTYKVRSAALVNGRPSYARDERAAIWFADGAWVVGSADRIGQRLGAMLALDLAATPDAISAQWSINQGDGTRKTSPTARCVSGDNGSSVAAEEARQLEQKLAALPRTVYITASKTDKVRRAYCGAYNVQRGRATVNGRLVYLREGSIASGKSVSDTTKMIWYAGGVWYVGVAKYIGTQMGAMLAVSDPALGPEQVSHQWRIFGPASSAEVAAAGANGAASNSKAIAAGGSVAGGVNGLRASGSTSRLSKTVVVWQAAPDVRAQSGKVGKAALDRYRVELSISASKAEGQRLGHNGRHLGIIGGRKRDRAEHVQ